MVLRQELAMLAVYKVIWEDDNVHASDVVAATNEAISDGVDVINISIHDDDDLPLFENAVAMTSFSAMKKRHICFLCSWKYMQVPNCQP